MEKTDDVNGTDLDGLIRSEETKNQKRIEYRLEAEIDKKIEEGDPAFGVFFYKVCEKLFGKGRDGEIEYKDGERVFHSFWIPPLQARFFHKNGALVVSLFRTIPGDGKPYGLKTHLYSGRRRNRKWIGTASEGSTFKWLFLFLAPLTSHMIFLRVHGMLQIDSTPTDILAYFISYIAVPASYFFLVRPHFRKREKRATDDGFIKLVSAIKSYPSTDAGNNRDPYWEMAGEAMPHGRMKDTGLTAFLDLYHQTYGAGNISPDTFMENKKNLAAILKRRFGVYSLDRNEDFKSHILNAGLLEKLEVKLTPRKSETEIEFYSYLSGTAEKVGFASTMALVFFVVFMLPILMSYSFIVIPWQAYPFEALLGLIFLILFGGQAIGAGVSFMVRAWRKGKIRRGLPDLLDLLEEMSNNPGQKISSARSSEAKGPGLLGILRVIPRIPALILGGMAAAMARVSFIRKMLFRVLPVSALNAAGFSEMKFVKADYLPIKEAIDHVWNHRPGMVRVREVYWSEVDNKNIKAKSSSARDAGELKKKWLEDLVRYWIENGFYSFEVENKEYMGKEVFQMMLKSNGIPRPPTWR